MSNIRELDSCKCPLDGIYLIEASAGTGKTYNIQNLAVRLIVEKGFSIDQILIVTFTKMATAELSDRIRKIIQSTFNYLDLIYKEKTVPEEIDFSREKSLLENVLPDFSDRQKVKEIRNRLQDAVLDFDNNAISTIHGFCQKMLNKNAFESGILFQTELTDSEQLNENIIELIRNQWRKICYAPENKKYVGLYRGLLPFDQCFEQNSGEAYDDYILSTGGEFYNWGKTAYVGNYVPSSMWDFVNLIEHPEISFDVEEAQTPEFLAAEIFALLESLQKFDPEMPVDGIGDNEYSVQDFLECQLQYGYGWQNFEELLTNVNLPIMENSSRKDAVSFAETLQNIIKSMLRFRVSILCRIRENIAEQLAILKRRDNFQTYDDLQQRMISALNAPGSTLAETLRQQFKAAVIDEFQDTDQIQYEIFTKIFAPDLSKGKRDCTLFLVGDPKQAIYAFRGGDIFTYKGAANAVKRENTLSLNKNFRSADALVSAVNEIFSSHNLPFADSSIEFESVESSGNPPLIIDGSPDQHPFHYLLNKGKKELIYDRCAEKICEILSTDVQLPGEDENTYVPVKPSDIAVLFRYRFEMECLQQKLQKRGIPYVVNNKESIYDTQEARDLEKLLLAILNPSDVKAVTWLMQTHLVHGKNCRALCELEYASETASETKNALSEVQEVLTELKCILEQKGFPVMFQKFMEIFEIHKRYPGLSAGAQKYSNLLQLRDVLAEKEKQGCKTPGLLTLWLQKQLAADTRTDLETGVILPTDAPAVKIMTIHNSKGLQFPIVFLPDLADIEIKESKAAKYHDPSKNNRIYHRITDGESTSFALAESLQEELRIAYVAFTRASRASYLIIPEKGRKFNAVSWLFTAREINPATPAASLKEAFLAATDKTLSGNILEQMSQRNEKEKLEEVIISDKVLPASQGKEISRLHWDNTQTPVPTPKISYSSAHKFFRRNERRSVSDEETSGSISPEKQLSETKELADVFTLPRGDLFGTACHTILEQLDFQKPDNLDLLIKRYLSVVNIGEKAEIAAEMFRKVISAPLPFGDGTTFSLSEISNSERCSEMDFDFKLDRKFDPIRLGIILNEYYSKRLEEDQLEKLFALRDLPGNETFYTGSADLIFRHKGKFFIVDWKTDILEKTLESFDQKYLFGEMWQKFYLYQSLLYSAALIRFLSLRLDKPPQVIYDQYFGGTIYLFLRGVDPAVPGRGIYADKPDFELIGKIAEME